MKLQRITQAAAMLALLAPLLAHAASTIQLVGQLPFETGEFNGSFIVMAARTGDIMTSNTVDFATSDGAAMDGQDYLANSGTLSFAPGETNKTISIQILNDGLREGNESFRVTLSNPTGGAVLGARQTITVVIYNNDSGFTLNAPTPIPENVGEVQVQVYRGNDLQGSVSVNYSTSDVTATNGVDYTGISGTLVFDSNESFQSLSIPILNDGQKEPNESFRLRLSDPSSGTSLGTPSTVTFSIQDNDPGFEFEAWSTSIRENEGVATVTVLRGNDLNASTSVNFATSDGTAASGADYASNSGTLVFAPGETQKSFQVPILNDPLVEGTEAIQLTLNDPSAGVSLGLRRTSTLNILDNETGFEFPAPTFTVAEAAGQVIIKVERSDDAHVAATVDYSTLAGTASPGADYTDKAGTLSFAPGELQKTFVIPILNDGLTEPTENVTLTLSNANGGFLGTRNSATLSINDNDGRVEFTSNALVASEDSGTALIGVRRGDDGPQTVTVQYATSAGSASPGLDYAERSGTLSFAVGESIKYIEIPLLNDGLPESDETVQVRLLQTSGPNGLGALQDVVLTIHDNDLALSFDSTLLTEKSGSTNLLLRRGDDGNFPITVSYKVTGGTATPGADFTLTDGTVNFPPGFGTMPIPIAIIDDPLAEGDETSELTLINLTVNQTNTLIVTLADDEKLLPSGDPQFRADLPPNIVLLAVAQQPDGRVLISFRDASNNNQLVRLNMDGSRDASFHPAIAGGEVTALAIQAEVFILMGGTFSEVEGVTRRSLARLNPDGSLDTSFDPGSVITDGDRPGSVTTIAAREDGKVLVGGSFSLAGEPLRLPIILLKVDGSRDTKFVPPAASLAPAGLSSVRIVQPLFSGQVLVGGLFQVGISHPRYGLVRLGGDGSLDESFDAQLDASADVHALALQSDDKILLGGYFLTVGGVQRNGIARLNSDGVLDDSFDSRRVGGEPVQAIISLPDGRVLAGGFNFEFPSLSRYGLIRLLPDGSYDPSLPIFPGPVRWILPPVNNTVLIAGDFEYVNDFLSRRLARLFIDNSSATGVQLGESVLSLSETNRTATLTVERLGNTSGSLTINYDTHDGTASAGADYSALSGSLTFNALENVKSITLPILDDGLVEGDETLTVSLRSASPDVLVGYRNPAVVLIQDNEVPATLDRAFVIGPGVQSTDVLLLQPDGKVVLGTYAPELEPNRPFRIIRLNPDGSNDPTFQSPSSPDGPFRVITLDAQGRLLIGGYFNELNGLSRPYLARLNSDGSLDSGFVPPPDIYSAVVAVTVASDGRVFVGIECGPVLRLNTDGSRDATFQADLTSLSGCLRSAIALPDGKVLVAGDGGEAGSTLMRLESNGVIDSSFHIPVFKLLPGSCCPFLKDIKLQTDGKILVAGHFSSVDGVSRGSIARLNPDGTVDATFATDPGARQEYDDGGIYSAEISACTINPDGHILIGGYFNKVNRESWPNLARLDSNGAVDRTFGSVELLGGSWRGPGISSIAIQADSNVIIGGSFTSVNAVPQRGIARLYSSGAHTTFEFTEPRFNVPESSAAVTISVQRRGDVSAAATVRYVMGAGTATDGVDYQSQTGTLTFAPLETIHTFIIPVLDDQNSESDETVPLTLSDATGVSHLGLPKAQLRILDDEHPGSLDGSFQPPFVPTQSGYVGQIFRHGLLAMPDGATLVAGDLYVGPRTSEDYRSLLRLDQEGSIDPGFKPDPNSSQMFPLSDGSVIIRDAATLRRLKPDGSLDPRFSAAIPQNLDLRDITLQPDGRLVVVGNDCSVGPCRGRVLRFHANGSDDASFVPPLLPSDSYVQSVLVLDDDSVLVSGYSYNSVSPLRNGVVRLLPGGDRDPGFTPRFPSDYYPNVTTMLRQSDGKILLGGVFLFQSGTNQIGSLIRLLPNGSFDPEFIGGSGSFDQFGNVTGEVIAMAEQSDGRLLVAGTFRLFHGVPRHGLVRLNADGTLDPTFDIGDGFRSQDQNNFDGYSDITGLALLSNGQVLVSGNFTHVNGARRPLLARLNGDGQQPAFYLPEPQANGTLRLTVAVESGRTYVLQVSTDLLQWNSISTNQSGGATLVWDDEGALLEPHLFYRVVQK